jgi:hypothetical protein
MWCRLGNKQKNEGKYRRPLEKKLGISQIGKH